MFKFLKEKISKVVKSLSEKIETKKPVEKKIEVEKLVKKEVKKGIIKKVFEKVTKKVLEKRISEKDLEEVLENLEFSLLEADVAFEVAEKIKEDLKKNLVGKEVRRGKVKDMIIQSFKDTFSEILDVTKIDLENIVKEAKKENRPVILIFFGFNGCGKTTSLAKLGKWLRNSGYSCVFAASDTFRSAALEQLEEHAKKVGVEVIKHKYGADPAAVAYDAIAHAKTRGINFVLIDTAGRAHTNRNLMEQMQKIIRVSKPDLKILVMDSLVGNDAILQAKMFNELGIDAIIFTKVDVNQKGGAILSVSHLLNKPILFLGTGQSYSDFKEFDKEWFINQLLSE
ncbi:MAG: signal recognition particle-docking protein FtsY [Candidatus Aenigmarchaeota archaeon]|nr:signal recognition particle-docking protein FtsY [Candidatus Aenigmarchaeota archaeon]